MSAWKDFVTTSLLGTEKSAAISTVPTALGEVLGPTEKLNPEARFLTRAGALALWRRAGWKPVRGEARIFPLAPVEAGSLVNPMSIAHLRMMLGGRNAAMIPEWLNQAVLPEWLNEVARLRRRLPPEWLPALLEKARLRDLRPAVLAAGGALTRWLAEQNPAWNFAAECPSEQWETGQRDQRVHLLREWRAHAPAQAGEKLAAAWKTESADARQAFLAVVGENLSENDMPFLEAALDDRSKEVRLAAENLLSRLPGSPLVVRMVARAAPLLVFKRGGLLTRATIQASLPGELDTAARRDGLNPKDLLHSPGLGEKAVLLAHILAAVPLSHWTNLFQQTPAALLAAADRSEFAGAVVGGWALATVRQRDAAWAAVMLDGLRLRDHTHFVSNVDMFEVLAESEREERLLAAVRADPLKTGSSEAVGWAHLLGRFGLSRGYLPEELTRRVLDQLRRVASTEPQGLRPISLHNVASVMALRTPPALLSEAVENWPDDKEGVAALLASLTFRRDALAALTQP